MKKVLCLFIVLIITLSGCIKEKKYMNSEEDNHIVCSFGELPPSLNNMDEKSGYYNGIYTYLFEGLVASDRIGNIEPALAESWVVSDNGIGYTFNLRPDAKWSDGTKISAEDFVTFFKYILSNKSKASSQESLYVIFGAEDYSKGKINFEGVAITAEDDSTLEIRLNKPSPDLLKTLSDPKFVLRKNFLLLEQWKNNYKEIQSSGAFVIDNIDEKGVALRKNNNYWDSNEVTDEFFLLLEGRSKEELLAAFEVNKVNIMLNPPVSEMDRIISNSNTIIANSKDRIILKLNISNSPILKSVNIRRDLMESIDTKELIITCLKEFKPEEYEMFKPIPAFKDISSNNANINSEEDIRKSKISLVLLVVSDDINKRVGRGIKEQLESKLEARVSIKYVMKEELQEEINKGNYDMLLQKSKDDYDEKLSSDIMVKPLFNNVDIVIKSDYIEGVDVDPYQNIILRDIIQK